MLWNILKIIAISAFLFVLLIPEASFGSEENLVNFEGLLESNNEECSVYVFGLYDYFKNEHPNARGQLEVNYVPIIGSYKEKLESGEIAVIGLPKRTHNLRFRYSNSGFDIKKIDCYQTPSHYFDLSRTGYDLSLKPITKEDAKTRLESTTSFRYFSQVDNKFVSKKVEKISIQIADKSSSETRKALAQNLTGESPAIKRDHREIDNKYQSKGTKKVPIETNTASEKSGIYKNLFASLPTSHDKMNRHAIAVIIGNRSYSQNYKDVSDVEFAHNDAEAMKYYVTKVLGYREGNIILLNDATQAEFISTFGNEDNPRGKLYNWIRPEKSDVFVYYSGHGAPGLNNGHGYLLPVDADPMAVELNGYPLETLYANLAKLPSKSLTVVVDACFSGYSQNGTLIKSASPIVLKHIDLESRIPNATILTAADINEVASWDTNAKMGLFTRHFIEGVLGNADNEDFGNDDGEITLGELKTYLESEVTYMARRLYNRNQHPQVSGSSSKILRSMN